MLLLIVSQSCTRKNTMERLVFCCCCLKYDLNLLSNIRMKVILALAVAVALLAVVEGRR